MMVQKRWLNVFIKMINFAIFMPDCLGAVIRDGKGIDMGAVAKRISGSLSPLLAECLALREGLQFFMDSGLHVRLADRVL